MSGEVQGNQGSAPAELRWRWGWRWSVQEARVWGAELLLCLLSAFVLLLSVTRQDAGGTSRVEGLGRRGGHTSGSKLFTVEFRNLGLAFHPQSHTMVTGNMECESNVCMGEYRV